MERRKNGWMAGRPSQSGRIKWTVCDGLLHAEDISFQFALAEALTLCDAYHCSLMGPTYPNRMYLMTGMIDPDGQ